MSENNLKPNHNIRNTSYSSLYNIGAYKDVLEMLNNQASQTAEKLFEILIDLSDQDLSQGKIPFSKDKDLNNYIKILRRLFPISLEKGIKKTVSRGFLQSCDPKTYSLAMCLNSNILDTLCAIVNHENSSREPQPHITISNIRSINSRSDCQSNGNGREIKS